MPTIEDLEKEIQKLKQDNSRKEQKIKNVREGKFEMKALGRKKKLLQKELKKLRSPKTSAFKKGLGKGAAKTGRGIISTVKAVDRFIEGFEDFEESQQRRAKPRTTKRKTKTTKRKTKTTKRKTRKRR